ncbi:EAL domain-containing protein [Microvirga tunisiensis]|uniref:EAL domain-containing protein n=1 Tax=Microvirga tunisiensis TaxID=2108360 RepID=A0A5N7MSY7_9HYPH|nr:EAL domain-containing protein [Microvirga tunisiensis]MPR11591.1 EAL domain-containing protein [Microvirga tunisiensis]MPR29589.1 EAL domain-containing protein [Microvirga tunisiensis]
MSLFKRFAADAASKLKRGLAQSPVWHVVLLAVVINLTCGALIWNERGVALRKAETSSRNLVAAAGRDISRNIKIIDLTLLKIINKIRPSDPLNLPPEFAQQFAFDEVAAEQYYSAIGVVDATDRVIFQSRMADPGVLRVGHLDYVKVHRESPDVGLYVSAPIKSPYGFGWALVLSRRMSSPDGSYAGVAYVALSLDYFTDLFRRMNLGPKGTMTLARNDGKVIVREPSTEQFLGADLSKAELYRHYPREKEGAYTAQHSPLDGVARLYTYAQIGDLPIVLNVGRWLDDVYGQWRRRALTIAAVLFSLTGAMIAMAINLRREFQRRRVAHQDALRNEALFREAMKGAGIATALLRLDGSVLKVNPAFSRLFGYSEEEAQQNMASDVVFPGDEIPDDGPVLRGEIDVSETERRYVRKDGTVVFVLRSSSLMRDEAGQLAYFIVQYQDITARREAENRLRYNATHDDLTGLLNRTAFEQRLQEALLQCRETGIRHALAFVDLDRLKIINDSAGHIAGDALLRAVAGALPTYLRKVDVVGRLGGDEFGIILFDCSLDDATEVLERLNTAAGAIQFPWEGRIYKVGASIGVTEITPESGSPSSLLAQADIACLTAKMAGRNRVSIYHPEQSEAVERHRELSVAAGIKQAIREGRLRLFAQRIVACSGAPGERYEVLVRMVNSDGTLIPPSVFIPAAERYDLIGDIDRWVIWRALHLVRDAVRTGPSLRIHLNLSARSLGDESFLAYVLETIEASGTPPVNLVFEITETALVTNMAIATGIVGKLREIGCQIALDDFGSGLSSFNYLRTFPVDIVKIDGTFVRSMTTNLVDRRIVKSIHQIAQELGAETVAEYVEDKEAFQILATMGITFAQGYALHKPQPFEAVLDQHLVSL